VDVSVGAPVVVEGRLWGVIQAGWSGDESPPADTLERMARFAELVATAIANADSRERLTASRARLLTEGDEARRRVVRDLHDGAQQRLVHTIITLKLANRALQQQQAEKVEAPVGEALEHAQQGNTELPSWPTASFPPSSHAVVCGTVSARSQRDSTYRFKSMSRHSGSRRRSREARTSLWPSRSRTSSSMRTLDLPKSRRSFMRACSTSRFATTGSVVPILTVTG
jgi:GAF domain-containing protein